MIKQSTIYLARALGSGCVLNDAQGRMYRVDNWSQGTSQVWGREITDSGDDYAAGDMIELPQHLTAKVHVLGYSTHRPGGFRWVLNLQPCSVGEALQKIRWQREPRDDGMMGWELATWDAALCRFIVEGQPRDVSEGPYTEAAWSEFTLSLPGVRES